MPARNLAPLRSLQREAVHLYFGGTGAATDPLTDIVGGTGLKASGTDQIDQTGTGLYTITLRDKWNALLFFSATIIDATSPDDWEVVVVAEDVADTKTIDIAVFKGGTLTDLTTDEKIRCMAVLSQTAQSPS